MAIFGGAARQGQRRARLTARADDARRLWPSSSSAEGVDEAGAGDACSATRPARLHARRSSSLQAGDALSPGRDPIDQSMPSSAPTRERASSSRRVRQRRRRVLDDALRAASRATALALGARFDSFSLGWCRAAPPALRSPGGMLVHFVPIMLGVSLAGRGFRPRPARLRTGRCQPRTDRSRRHGLAPDQLDTWILFSRSVLALEVGDSLELADPFGLVRDVQRYDG